VKKKLQFDAIVNIHLNKCTFDEKVTQKVTINRNFKRVFLSIAKMEVIYICTEPFNYFER